jgi:hypothetical protein
MIERGKCNRDKEKKTYGILLMLFTLGIFVPIDWVFFTGIKIILHDLYVVDLLGNKKQKEKKNL